MAPLSSQAKYSDGAKLTQPYTEVSNLFLLQFLLKVGVIGEHVVDLKEELAEMQTHSKSKEESPKE